MSVNTTTLSIQTNLDTNGKMDPSSTTTPTTTNQVALLTYRLDQAIRERDALEAQIKRKLAMLKDTSLLQLTTGIPNVKRLNLFSIRKFKAHTRPIRAVSWSRDSCHIVSASDDNNLIIWNSRTKLKEHFEPLQVDDHYAFACDISPDNNLVVCGGLSNSVSIFRIRNNNNNNNNNGSMHYGDRNDGGVVNRDNIIYGADPIQLDTSLSSSSIVCRFKDHTDWVTGVKFVSNHELISTSSDRKCYLWDINKGTKTRSFADNLSDITGLSLSPANENVFITSSAQDSTVRLYDIRDPNNAGLVEQFGPVGDDATAVEFFPSGNAFAVGTKESTISLFDIRSGSIKMEEFMLPISSITQAQLATNPSPTSTRFKQGSGRNNHNNLSNNASRRGSGGGMATINVDGVECLSFSNSGRILFITTQDLGCFAFDILKGEMIQELDKYSSLVKVSPDGYAVLTASTPQHCMELWTFM
ncbi:G protein subunit beta [Saccharomycopsis crataegensis]|uniref:G protein subunit beta n=1 Tax=Saccharomycopsis crataegensis TaxID=43959 RepID=A0AAV5QRX2_9ASCO|nr:G protein subunit beta [Saccharomycopsis crataegensis]